jgi:voltage-gated potassium channel Kch
MAASGERRELAHWHDHLVVCGDNPLTVQVVRELAAWSGFRVAVISPSGHRAGSLTGLQDVRVVEGSIESDDVLRAAGVVRAAGLAALLPDHVDNTRLARRALSLNPQLRLAIAGSDPAVDGGMLAEMGMVLSRSKMAARLFAAAAVGDAAPLHVQLPGRTLEVARRYEVPEGAVICGLADYSRSDGIRLLPAGAPDAELVVAVTEGMPPARAPGPRRPRSPGA